jgi:hypothetical protein
MERDDWRETERALRSAAREGPDAETPVQGLTGPE